MLYSFSKGWAQTIQPKPNPFHSHEEDPVPFHGTVGLSGLQSARLRGTRYGSQGGQHRSSERQRIGRPDHARRRGFPGQHYRQPFQHVRASQRPGDRAVAIGPFGGHLAFQREQQVRQ